MNLEHNDNSREYSTVSEIYSELMKNINYGHWAEYIKAIASIYFNNKNISTLELGAGTGELAGKLLEIFPRNIITDKSFNMLKRAKSGLPKLVCDMTYIPFKSKFDFIYSTFDSINYLLTEEQLNKAFSEVKRVLSADGVFAFDVSLYHNSINNVKRLNRKGKYKGIKYVQTSNYDDETGLHKNEFVITSPSGEVYYEKHIQMIHDLFSYFKVLENNNLYVAECFESFTFDDVNNKSERAQFVVKHA